jgi:hypothetical protein
MRVRRVIVLGVVGGVSAVAAACGLEQAGLMPGDDGGVVDSGRPDVVFDVQVPDIYVPPACTTLDASCLLPYPADAGWNPVAATSGACPNDLDAGWTKATFQNDASIVQGSCAPCGCTVNAPACALDAGFTNYSANGCSSGAQANVLAADACVNISGSNGSASGSYPAPSVTTCDASGGGDAQVQTGQVNVCATGSCAIDYCGLKNQGYALCIKHDGVVACPSGYVSQTVGATAAATCGACGCAVTQQKRCAASVVTYQNSDCDSPRDTTALDGSCQGVQNFSSARLRVVENDAACAASTTTPAFVDLLGKVTLCCLP